MKEITLIGTVHKENGDANPASLCEILESIKPEVIFLEVSSNDFNHFYIKRDWQNLESIAIFQYLNFHEAELVHVDQTKADVSSYMKSQKLHSALDFYSTPEFQKKYDENNKRVSVTGFEYLNSDDYSKVQIELNESDLRTVQKIADPEIASLHSWWLATHAHRENVMLSNIYDYCECNSFKKAVFLVGAAHRHSIIRLIQDTQQSIEVSWHYYLNKYHSGHA